MKVFILTARIILAVVLLGITTAFTFIIRNTSKERTLDITMPGIICGERPFVACCVQRIHLLIGSNGKVYYHDGYGLNDGHLIHQVAFVPPGHSKIKYEIPPPEKLNIMEMPDNRFGDFLREKNRLLLARMSELQAEQSLNPEADTIYNRKLSQIRNSAGPVIYIKPLADSKYGDVVEVIDQLRLAQVSTWFLSDITSQETNAMEEFRSGSATERPAQ